MTNPLTPVKRSSYYRASTPTCPHCGYAMNDDDMMAFVGRVDLFAMVPNQDREAIECPICDKEYWVQGSYAPQYTSAFAEEDL